MILRTVKDGVEIIDSENRLYCQKHYDTMGIAICLPIKEEKIYDRR